MVQESPELRAVVLRWLAAVEHKDGVQRDAAGQPGPAQLRVRIGIHTGDVVHTSDDFLGHAVNKAARIASVAEGGQTMLSQVTRELVGSADEFEFGEPCTCQLKGLEGPHILIPLVG